MGDICSESKLGNLQLFLIYLIWESLKISVGKICFLIGRIGNIIVKF